MAAVVCTKGGLPNPNSVAVAACGAVAAAIEKVAGLSGAQVAVERERDDVAVLLGGLDADAAKAALGDDVHLRRLVRRIGQLDDRSEIDHHPGQAFGVAGRLREIDAILVGRGAGARRAGAAGIGARLQEGAAAERRVFQGADAVGHHHRAACVEHAIDRGRADIDHRQVGGMRGQRRR